MPNGGKIDVSFQNVHLDEVFVAHQKHVAKGPYVLLSVTDTGTGISKETS